MKTSIIIQLETGDTVSVLVSAKLTGQGVTFPNSSSNMLHNRFKVTFKTNIGSASCDYYDSNLNYTNGTDELNEDGLKNALECFLSDALSANCSFNDFCDASGYDNDSRTAERIYKACLKNLDKAGRILGSRELVSDIYHAFAEMQNA